MSKLTLQQELQLRQIEIQIKESSKEQLELTLMDMCRIMFEKENMYRDMLLRNAGIIQPYE
jgi:Phycobilisome degradation protein nblA